MFPRLLTCLLLSPSFACQATPAEVLVERPPLESVLANIQRAVGAVSYGKSGAPVTLSGRALNLGEEVDCHLTFAPGGNYAVRLSGELGSAQGFDGSEAWETGFDGSTRRLELEERDRTLLTSWIQTGHWLDARAPIDVSWASSDRDGTLLQVRLRDTPLTGVLEVDAGTGLPSGLRMETNAADKQWSFQDWRDVGGVRVAHHVRIEQEGAPETWMRWESHAAAPVTVRSPFSRPRGKPRGTVYEPSLSGPVPSIKLASGHVMVNPRVNGRDVGWFLLDSGAGATCIERRVARELGMRDVGDLLAVGTSGSTEADMRRGERLSLGPVTLEDPNFLALDLRFLASLSDERISGILGYDLFARCVLELDSRSGDVALYAPESYSADVDWQVLRIDSRVPTVEARFEGDHSGFFRIDSGAGGTVTFHSPLVEELELLEGRKVRRGRAGGVGGSAPVYSGRIAWFELAGHRFEGPTVDFATADTGALSDRYLAGNLGQTFLEPFRLVFDYPNERIAFVPR